MASLDPHDAADLGLLDLIGFVIAYDFVHTILDAAIADAEANDDTLARLMDGDRYEIVASVDLPAWKSLGEEGLPQFELLQAWDRTMRNRLDPAVEAPQLEIFERQDDQR